MISWRSSFARLALGASRTTQTWFSWPGGHREQQIDVRGWLRNDPAKPIVFDSTFSNLTDNRKMLDRALDSGRKVTIEYIYRDPLDAYQANLERAKGKGKGRVVKPSVHANTHQGAAETVRALYDEFKDDPRVTFHFIDNSGAHPGESSIELTSKGDYTNLRSRIEALDAERQAETETAEGPGIRSEGRPVHENRPGESAERRRTSQTGEAAGTAKEVSPPGPNKTEKLEYRKGHDWIKAFVRRRPHGWTADGEYNLQGQAGGHLGDSGYLVGHPTREAAVNAFVESALREGSGVGYELKRQKGPRSEDGVLARGAKKSRTAKAHDQSGIALCG